VPSRQRYYIQMQKILIRKEPVELYKILKFEGLVASGGEAKMVIDQGMVSINRSVEMRKRRKMIAGDVIEFNGDIFVLELDTAGD